MDVVENTDTIIVLSESAYLENKTPFGQALTVAPVDVEGVSASLVTVGNLTDWVRIVIAIPPLAVQPGLIAARLVFRLQMDQETVPAQMRAMLAMLAPRPRRLKTITDSTVDFQVAGSGLYQVSGLFACAVAPTETLHFMMRLPNNCRVTILALDLEPRDAVFGAAAQSRLAESRVEMLAPFALTRLRVADVAQALAAPALLKHDAALSRLDLAGYALTQPQVARVCLATGTSKTWVPAGHRVEIAADIEADCGFSGPLPVMGDDPSEALELFLDGAPDAPFQHIDVPPLLRKIVAKKSNRAPEQSQHLATLGEQELFFFPDYTATNPYQLQMYRNMPHTVARPGTLKDAVARLVAGARPGSVVMHLHWLHPLLAGATTPGEARRLQTQFREQLRQFVQLGGILLWTVHNTVSHDAKFREIEIELGQNVIDAAHWVHLHSETLLPMLAEYYRIPPRKLVFEPHPNYVGVYRNYVPRASARNRLGLPQDAKVMLFLGQLRPYKGIEGLAEAFGQVSEKYPDAILIVAGKPVHPYAPDMMRRTLQGYRNVRVIEGFIPDNDLQWFYQASDWVVLPYTGILTSGSLLCAMSFARPCIAPRLGMITDLVDHGQNGLLYDADNPQGLALALDQALATGPQRMAEMQAAAHATVAPLTWDKMGQRLEAICSLARQARKIPISFDSGTLECELLGPAFPPAHPHRTAIVILNYEHLDDVQRLLASLQQSSCKDFDTYLVDNASPSLSTGELANFADADYVLRMPENLGYAAGNNAVLRLIADLPYEFVWILNPDMVVSAQALDTHLAAAASHPDHAIFGPVILASESSSKIASAGCFVTFGDDMETGHMYAGEDLSVLPDTPFEVDFITGASVFLRKSVLDDIGLIPEDYFLYFEETHWLLAAARKGFTSLVLTSAVVSHYKRSEEDGLPAKYYFYYYIRNSLLFYSRMTGRAAGRQRDKLLTGFIENWLKKIKNRRPAVLDQYRRLAERALDDGMAGVSGRVDLLALEFDLLNLDAGDLAQGAVGAFDCDEAGRISGMVLTGFGDGARATITVLADGREIAVKEWKPTLQEPDMQMWNFDYAVDSTFPREKLCRIELRLNGRKLDGGDLNVILPRPAPSYQGRIDGVSEFICMGWALNHSNFDEKVEIEIVFENKVVARAMADRLRPDLIKNGIGDGVAGFEVRMPRMFSDGRKRKVGLRIAGTNVVLFEREVLDGKIGGGSQPKPVAVALEDLFYTRHMWLARHMLSELPLGQVIETARLALAAEHAERPETELVSVVMPAFNRETSILDAIASVQAQSYRNWELLIADDGSTDRTVELVQELIAKAGDTRIRLIALPENGGVSRARNAALAEAKGEVMAYLDSDNDWHPDFLRIMVGELMRQPRPGSAYCGQSIVQVCGPSEAPLQEMIALRMGPFHLPLLENRNYIDLNCFVHHRRLYQTLGGFAERLRRLVDWEIVLRYTRLESPHFVPTLLTNYYFDKAENQITTTEKFDHNMAVFNEIAMQHARKPVSLSDLRPVDIALLGGPGHDMAYLIQRGRAVLATVNKRADVRLLLVPPMGTQVDPAIELPPRIAVVSLPPEDGRDVTLHTVLAQLRPGADLILMQARAMPQTGWIEHFNTALAACPDGGVFVSRRMIPAAQLPKHAPQVPFAKGNRDACIALPADQRIVLNAQLDPDLNLIEIADATRFCTYVRQDVTRALTQALVAMEGTDAGFATFVQVLRHVMHRKVVYCGDVEVYEI